MAAFLSAALFGVAAIVNSNSGLEVPLTGVVSGLVVGVAMYLRYLKYYRQYAIELYVTYAEVDK